jgi:hypothetical protein
MTSLVESLRRVAQALDRLEVPYLIGGSLASSIHGLYRATADIDLAADLKPDHVRRLASELGPDYYADGNMMLDALCRGRAFNLIHYATGHKIDVFPVGDDPYYRTQFDRRRAARISTESDFEAPLATPEDTILTKLAWYRKGGCVSERQWNDVRGVIAVQGERLDCEYVRRWAPHLGVDDLLERALAEELPT